MKYLYLITITLLLSQSSNAQLQHFGSMSEMGSNDFAAAVQLDTLSNKANLFAIGPYRKMQGEITVFNGVPMIASIQNGKLQVEQSWDVSAPFFVSQNVRDWQEYEIAKPLNQVNEIQKLINELIEKQEDNLNSAFAFRITGFFDKITTHVVMPRTEGVPGYVKGKKQEVFHYENIEGEILGFYSNEGQGIYTGRNSKIHVHFRSKDMSVMGHLDAIESNKKLTVYLPNKINLSSAPLIKTNDTDFSKGKLGFKQTVSLKDLIKFHGHLCDGLVLGHLALNQALGKLYPEGVVDRTNTRIVSKSSPCLTDAAVYLTGGRYQFNTFYVDNEIDGLYKVERIDTKETILVKVKDNLIPKKIQEMGKLAVQQKLSACELGLLKSLEDDFSEYLLSEDATQFFLLEEIKSDWNPKAKNDYTKTDVLNKNAGSCD
jgi:acetolactate decarboxylase